MPNLDKAMRSLEGSGLWMIFVFPLSPLVYLFSVLPNQPTIRKALAVEELPEIRAKYRKEMLAVYVSLGIWVAVAAWILVSAL